MVEDSLMEDSLMKDPLGKDPLVLATTNLPSKYSRTESSDSNMLEHYNRVGECMPNA